MLWEVVCFALVKFVHEINEFSVIHDINKFSVSLNMTKFHGIK